MKKIKWLLIFWLFAIFWIGSSFASFIWNISYELWWFNRNYLFFLWNGSSQQQINFISSVNNNIPILNGLTSHYYSLYSWNEVFIELWVSTWIWSSTAYSPSNNLYYWSDFVSLFWKYSSSYGSIFNFNNSSNRSNSLYINQNVWVRLFLTTESNSVLCLNPELSSSELTWFYWWCNIVNYQIFPYNLWYSINSISTSVYDATYNSWNSILNSRKTAVFPWLWEWYSFIYEKVSSAWWFRSVFSWTLTSEDFSPYLWRSYRQNKFIDWQLIFNVNNISNWWSQWETTIIAIDSLNTWYYMYSLYNCPDSIISNCSFIEGWKLYSWNDLIIPSFVWNYDFFYGWLNFINTWSYYYNPIVYTYYDSIFHTLTFTRYWVYARSSTNTELSSFSKTINLVAWTWNDNYNVLKYLGIQWWDSSAWWSQSTYSWSFSYNDCEYATVYYYVTWSNWESIRISTQECLWTWVIASWSYVWYNWTIYYVSTWYNLDEISQWDLIYDTWYLDEDWFVSLDYYLTLFESPSQFKLWRCPYPPAQFFNFVEKFKIWNFYPFMPISCFASAFQQWIKVHYFDDFWLFPDINSQLIQWDTHFHKTLYRFFDFLLSIWLFFMLSVLLRVFNK